MRYMKYHKHRSLDNGFTLKKRLRDGKYIFYAKDNPELVLIAGNYKNRKQDGEWLFYDSFHKTHQYKTFKEGKLIFEQKLDSLGHKIFEATYNGNEINGNYYSYYFNGQLSAHEAFWRKKKESKQTVTNYYLNGRIQSTGHYRNGNGFGEFVYYYENGQKERELEWGKTGAVGIWKWWNEEGQLTQEKDYGAE